ncbi:peptidoglycan -binding protein [Yoonia sp.]|uniref:peptidoglycan -binding protein n=1 Tax=Yoonia sp. TaxID=2212373 RepID=UPI0025FDA2D5|nr:peptidoglycan -binding protein [Yoonia sp.]
MALSRRSSNRFQNAIWPGFVDAMTGLLLVLMFVLTIFMVIQFVLRETITGQESELDQLSIEVAALAATLGLEQDRNTALTATLNATLAQADQQASRIAALISERNAQDLALAQAQTRITGFEAQVAGLLAERADTLNSITGLEAEQSRLMTEREALNLALAQARTEIDAETEAARLAAARREALQALVADLRTEASQNAERISDLETAGLTDSAAAAALRERLANADTELTAMTLNLEQQRRKAEETLTLLAAARAARAEIDAIRATLQSDNADLNAQLADALAALSRAQGNQTATITEAERQAALLAVANQALSEQQALSAQSQRQVTLLNEQITELRRQVGNLQSLLNLAEQSDLEAQVQIETLGSQLNTALARVVSEERQRRALEEAERIRLEAETARLQAEAQDLARFKSNFFGQLREVLEGQDRIRIEGDRFVFSSEVLFEPGRAELSAQGQAEIANIADILRRIADDIPPGIDWVIRVDGHTDNIPVGANNRYADNWELSQARALSVVRFMSQDLGIPPDRLAANGFGEYQPLNPDDTPEARAQNRRIELKLTER